MEHLTAQDLHAYLNKRHIQAEILHLNEDTPTVPDAARVLGVSPEQIIKSLVFGIDGQPILVIANGERKIDPRKLADHFQVARKRVKFATAEQALEITGYVVGSMPPFGHLQTLPTYIDQDVTALQTIYGGGGDVHAMLKLEVEALLAVTQGTVLDLIKA